MQGLAIARSCDISSATYDRMLRNEKYFERDKGDIGKCSVRLVLSKNKQ